MSLTIFATIQRGETFQYSLSGRQTGDTIEGDLKPVAVGGGVPADTVDAVASFTYVTSDDVDGAGTDGWIGTLSAAVTAGLDAGNYVFDEKITSSGGLVDQTDAAIIRIVERVTE